MRLPNVIIIGAAKAGTTSLHTDLAQHPGIFASTPKEPEFFARDELFVKGLGPYSALFEAARPDQLVCESSTLYSLSPLFPDAPARIAAAVPDVKLIYCMRDPVERAFSYYGQLVKNFQNATQRYEVNRTFEDWVVTARHTVAAPRQDVMAPYDAHLPDTPELLLAGGDYVRQIEAYLAHFPREQMLFLTFEHYRRDRRAVLDMVTDFLDLDRMTDAQCDGAGGPQNVARAKFMEHTTQKRISAIKDQAGSLWSLRRMLPTRLRKTLIRSVIAPPSDSDPADVAPPPMEDATRALLQQRYAAMLPRLNEITGLDFSAWTLEPRNDDGLSI